LTLSIDVKKIMEQIRNDINENNSNEIIAENIISHSKEKYAKKRQDILNSKSTDSEKLKYLESIFPLLTSNSQKHHKDYLLKEIEQANISYDIQAYDKIDTSKPRIFRTLVLKFRNIIQNEIRFALNPIVDNQVKQNIHFVNILNELMKKYSNLENKLTLLENKLTSSENKLTSSENKLTLLENKLTSLLNDQKQIQSTEISRLYNLYVHREPKREEVKFWKNEMNLKNLSLLSIKKLISTSAEAISIKETKINSNIFKTVLDEHIFYLDPNDFVAQEAYAKTISYDPTTTILLKKLLKKGMNVINIGANIGYFTLLAAREVGTEGKVFSFEPFPNSVSLLKQNIDVNKYKNIEVIEMAVSNKSGTVKLSIENSSLFHIISEKILEELDTIDVNVTSIDQFLSERNTKIDFMIIDAEGSEPFILDGMKKTLDSMPNMEILIEYNPHTLKLSGSDGKTLLKKIKDLGFTINLINEENGTIEETGITQIEEQIQYPNVANLHLFRNKIKL